MVNLLNDNKIILLVCVVLANLNNKILKKEFERFEDLKEINMKDNYLIRKVMIFAMTYIIFRDFKLALAVALIFLLMNSP